MRLICSSIMQYRAKDRHRCDSRHLCVASAQCRSNSMSHDFAWLHCGSIIWISRLWRFFLARVVSVDGYRLHTKVVSDNTIIIIKIIYNTLVHAKRTWCWATAWLHSQTQFSASVGKCTLELRYSDIGKRPKMNFFFKNDWPYFYFLETTFEIIKLVMNHITVRRFGKKKNPDNFNIESHENALAIEA